MEISGNIFGSDIENFFLVAKSHIVAYGVTSLPVPNVVGILISFVFSNSLKLIFLLIKS